MFEFDDEVRFILGRPNFTCIHTATILRRMGKEIPNKAEEEQAAVIYFYLELYEKYGSNWREEFHKIAEKYIGTSYSDKFAS